MAQIESIILFGLSGLTAFLFSISPLTNLTPQLIALSAVILISLSLFKKIFSMHLVSFIICLLVFTTNGLNSPVFFLVYFLLFTVAFQNPPSTTLSFSLILTLLLSQSLNSMTSLLPLVSLLFITPLAWFVGKQFLTTQKLGNTIARDETEIFLWFSFQFKNTLLKIIDSASILLSDPKMAHSQKTELHNIKDQAKYLLKSGQRLTHEIDEGTDNED